MKKFKQILKQNNGMTLVETLTALSLLALMMFCFAPLFNIYLRNINLAGQKTKEVYTNAGIEQKFISDAELSLKYGYAFTGCGITMKGENAAAYTGPNVTGKLATTAGVIKTDVLGNPIQKKDEHGNPIENQYELLGSAGAFTTVVANGVTSKISCFPSTITDDFKEKKIVLVNRGLNPAEMTLYVSKWNGTTIEKFELTNGKDYIFTKTAGEDFFQVEGQNLTINIITLLGGTGNISFENSPLIVSTAGYEKKIEIDAPSVIMVGEGCAENNYYVASGELETVDNKDALVVIQRHMNSTDPQLGNVKLTSAMNDVAWVNAENGDGKNTYTDPETGESKYGYYVMCGEDGQVRRFWKSNKTGNYFWGGDHTMFTDMHLDRVANNKYITMTPTYALGTSYKFYARRDPDDTRYDFQKSSGYVLGDFDGSGIFKTGGNAIKSYNTWSLTALEDTNTIDDTYIYAPVGKLFYYQRSGNKESRTTPPLYKDIKNINVFGHKDYGKIGTEETWYYNVMQNRNEAMAWVKPEFDYAGATGETNHPISLTCAEAITLNTKLESNFKSYQDTTNLSTNNHLFGEGGEGLSVGKLNYPQESYTLYCGYIPAFMDIFANHATKNYGVTEVDGAPNAWKYPDKYYDYPSNYFNGSIVRNHQDNMLNYSSDIINDNFEIRDSALTNIKQSNFNQSRLETARLYARWKGNFGVTPYIPKTDKDITLGEGESLGKRYFKSWKETDFLDFYPYTNLKYTMTGKFGDSQVEQDDLDYYLSGLNTLSSFTPAKTFNTTGYIYDRNDGVPQIKENKQQNMTGGELVDMTVSYYSHPFIVEAGANPTDQVVYDLSNDKVDRTFYWNNRRETVTMLDCASTTVPVIGGTTQDPTYDEITVSLMGGYTMGGTVQYIGYWGIPFINTIMNNGIIYLRAGDANYGKQSSTNSKTGEWYANENDGYKLAKESNVFHQFYYLDSLLRYNYWDTLDQSNKVYWHDFDVISGGLKSQAPNYGDKVLQTQSLGNLYGARGWQNNRHIDFVSMNGGEAVHPNGDNLENNYNYLRCHPMSNTKVYCVAWGQTWNGNPEAMWGTENGTVISCEMDVQSKPEDREYPYQTAELQSYKWVDNINDKEYAVGGQQWLDSVASRAPWKKGPAKCKFKENISGDSIILGNMPVYMTFFDYRSRMAAMSMNGGVGPEGGTGVNTGECQKLVKDIGVISTLSSINDVCYSDDMWVAVGDQGYDEDTKTHKQPYMYGSSKGGTVNGKSVFPYTGDGGKNGNGSWVYVRYNNGEYKVGDSIDCHYLWKAVKISDNNDYNIVQINNINGMWIATGYVDKNHNTECDPDEETVVCWTYNPLEPAGSIGGWSDNTIFYEYKDKKFQSIPKKDIQGINSVATR